MGSSYCLALAISRPRGLNEAWPAVGGAAALLALGLLSPPDLVSAAQETAGVFVWASSYAVRASGGSSRRLLVNVVILGAIVTALLSLDVTVIILTPVIYATVVALRVEPLPYLYACTFVANTGSLVFPMSNLTNLLVVDRLGLPFSGRPAVPPGATADALNALWRFPSVTDW